MKEIRWNIMCSKRFLRLSSRYRDILMKEDMTISLRHIPLLWLLGCQ
jgi:hypothetical protein